MIQLCSGSCLTYGSLKPRIKPLVAPVGTFVDEFGVLTFGQRSKYGSLFVICDVLFTVLYILHPKRQRTNQDPITGVVVLQLNCLVYEN